ncbi:hypothetical protein CRYUN_Cryun03dG0046100 [Craigia yunnanensis]
MEKNSNTKVQHRQKNPDSVQRLQRFKLLETCLNKNMDGSDQKLEDREKLKTKKDELLIKREKAEGSRKKLEKYENADSLEKKHGPAVVNKVERTPELGKKKRVLVSNVFASPATTTTNTVTEKERSDGTQMPRVTDVVAGEANDKLMDVPKGDSYNLSPVTN